MPKATRRSLRRARRFRRALTKPELMVWQELRHRPTGYKFRRQHPIGDYVLDFYCAAAKLAVEIDGLSHDMGDRPHRDELRDAWLNAQGIETFRIPAAQVLEDLPNALELIVEAISRRMG